MKTPVVLLLALALVSKSSRSQMVKDQNNQLKVNVSSFVAKGIGVQYERRVGRRFTVALGYSLHPNSSIAFESTIKKIINKGDMQLGDIKFGSYAVTPEFRYYMSRKGSFHGIYLAPYVRISQYKLKVPLQTTASANDRTILFNGRLNNITGGLLLGANIRLSERVYLDWWILGAGIGSASGSLATITPLSETEQDALNDNLSVLDIPFTKIRYDIHGNGATISSKGTMAGIRGLGINLGFSF